MKMARQTLAIALMCVLAAHCAVDASRLGPVRKLTQVPGGMGGVYAWNGSGIVVVNTVVYVNAVVIVDTGYYGDGTVVYLEGGIEFGVIYGGIIYPPNQAQYYPVAIVNVVVFGPVFAQSWFIGPNRVICWSMTIFYRPGGVRIYNPVGYSGPFYNSAGVQLGTYSNSVPRIEDNTIIQQNNVVINNTPPPQRQVTPPSAAGKSPISSAIGQQGVTVSPGAAPGGSPGADRSPRSDSSPGSSPGLSRSPGAGDNRSPGTSSSPDANRRSGSPGSPSGNSSPDTNRRSGSPAANNSPDQNRGSGGSPAPAGNGGSPDNRRRDANGSPVPDNSGGGGGAGANIGGGGNGGGGDGGFGGGGGGRRGGN